MGRSSGSWGPVLTSRSYGDGTVALHRGVHDDELWIVSYGELDEVAQRGDRDLVLSGWGSSLAVGGIAGEATEVIAEIGGYEHHAQPTLTGAWLIVVEEIALPTRLTVLLLDISGDLQQRYVRHLPKKPRRVRPPRFLFRSSRIPRGSTTYPRP
jgi:hypothetical protein